MFYWFFFQHIIFFSARERTLVTNSSHMKFYKEKSNCGVSGPGLCSQRWKHKSRTLTLWPHAWHFLCWKLTDQFLIFQYEELQDPMVHKSECVCTRMCVCAHICLHEYKNTQSHSLPSVDFRETWRDPLTWNYSFTSYLTLSLSSLHLIIIFFRINQLKTKDQAKNFGSRKSQQQ